MVDVRCRELDNDLWTYVTEYARLRRLSRCDALEHIILEHMKFAHLEHQALLDGNQVSSDKEWVNDIISVGIGASASYFLWKRLASNGEDKERIKVCPHCGREIRKWAVRCPYCRLDLQIRFPKKS